MFHSTTTAWHYSIGFNILVDLCVWVLAVDGLRMAPFDRHDDGDDSHQARGLDTAQWRSWTEQVIAAIEAITRRSRDPSGDKFAAIR